MFMVRLKNVRRTTCMHGNIVGKKILSLFKKNKLYNREKYLRQLRLFIRIWLNLCIVPEIPKERERNAYILPQQ